MEEIGKIRGTLPTDEQACDVEWRYTEEGQRVRVSIRTGRVLAKLNKAFETIDYVGKNVYKENPAKDTLASAVEEVTYEPSLATFEMDLMKQYGIKEDRVPRKTFWY